MASKSRTPEEVFQGYLEKIPRGDNEAWAKKMGVSRFTLTRWRNGAPNPSLKNLKAAAKAFGVSIFELLSDEVVDRQALTEARAELESLRGTLDKILRIEEGSRVVGKSGGHE